jgi:phosphoglycolate phosphatase-like HAD superfamily hydrolase
MKLVIFDIDGTLLDAAKADTICFLGSLQEAFGQSNIDTRWETYRHTTAAGIFEEIFERTSSRKPSESEIRRHIDRQTKMYEELHSQKPGMFVEVSGACDILTFLGRHPDWQVGIATGGWKKPALLKLKSIGIECDDLLLASCSDAISREDILRKCIDLSKEQCGITEFEKIVSVGDAVWDLKTAAKLKLGFIGISTHEEFKDYENCRVLQDFRNQELFMQYLEEARVPRIG